MKNYPIVILISGSGTNLQAIIDAQLPIDIKAVISNVPTVYGLTRAKQAGIKTHVIEHHDYSSREGFDKALADCIDQYQPKLIVLAGFMRILGQAFIKRFQGKIINLHPSLLPKYPGLQTHKQVIKNGDKEHGCTVHFVTEALDSGPIIAQAKLSVAPDDTPETLKARIQKLEHQLLPQVIASLAKKAAD